jgi:hypothetical protein
VVSYQLSEKPSLRRGLFVAGRHYGLLQNISPNLPYWNYECEPERAVYRGEKCSTPTPSPGISIVRVDKKQLRSISSLKFARNQAEIALFCQKMTEKQARNSIFRHHGDRRQKALAEARAFSVWLGLLPAINPRPA